MQRRKVILLALSLLCVIGAGIIDIIIPPKYIVATFYIIPILLVTFSLSPRIISLITLFVMLVFTVNAHFFEGLNSIQIIFQLIGYFTIGFLAIRISVEKRKNEDNIKQLELFMHMISHDLAQPLTAIRIYSQTLERKSDMNTKKSASKITASLNSLQKLILDLKDIAQARNGKFTVYPKRVDLHALITTLVKHHQKTTSTHKIIQDMQKDIVGNWDIDRLYQVINNLLSNAIKYTKGGNIYVKVIKDSNSVLISIRDSGTGISPEQQKLMFQPYMRVGSNKEIRGSGLGLYITKLIVESHNGHIWISSVKGQGSTFFIELPLRSEKRRRRIV